MSDASINEISHNRQAHYEPFGWHHWPEHPWLSYQFRRALGETQEGGGAVSECFQAASRMIPGDKESWHREWLRVADRNFERGNQAESHGHIRTAMNAWLRAVDYYRSAEFWLGAGDSRRLEVFGQCELSFQKAMRYFSPAGEFVEIPYGDSANLPAYFLKSLNPAAHQPVLIAFGGLDSFKEELYFMVGRGALQRGISVLLVDGPGQGATLRRQKIHTRYDYEVPVGACIDYLETRDDVDLHRIAVSGASLGGYYASRAGAFEHRLAAAISHGAIWRVNDLWESAGESHGLAEHVRWVFGTSTVEEAVRVGEPFSVENIFEHMKCPYLIVNGGHDVLGVQQAQKVFERARAAGVDVTLKIIPEEMTGAEHCQHDNPTLGQEVMLDWLTDRLAIDQRQAIGHPSAQR